MKKHLLIVSVLLASYTSGYAQIVRYTATGTFTSTDFAGIVDVGDRFALSFTVNQSATDSYDDTAYPRSDGAWIGYYGDALLNMNFSLLPGATGSYAGGSFTIPRGFQAFDGVTNVGGNDAAYFSADPRFGAVSFGNIGSHAFAALDVSLFSAAPTFIAFSSARDQTFSAVLDNNRMTAQQIFMGIPGAITLAGDDYAVRAIGQFDTFSSEALSAVPEPSTYAAWVGGLALLGTFIVRRKRVSAKR